ncbi:hypothetical protein GGI08_001386 [Coemansia sp. S2]|nr:hypothetical protein GGI08_001386 [Coemansia sp. S2]
MKMPFGGVSSDKHKLKALLSVCHSWREVALEYLWNKAKLRLNANSNRVRLTRPPWIKENVLSRHTANMVKELHSEPSDESVTNVLDFAELLKSMAPAAKTTEVVCVTKSW